MLIVHGKEGTRVLQFSVFDRWGELVYQNGDFMVNDIDGLQDIVKGHTTLVR